jgi:uncharacterized membrane protein YdbT with pleckstrin-like domain
VADHPPVTPDSSPTRAAEWIYSGVWRALVNWFRVPDRAPRLPVSAGERLEQFKPDRGFLGYLRLAFWIGFGVWTVALVVGWIVLTVFVPVAGALLVPVLVTLIVVPGAIGVTALHLRFDTTWYVMTDRSMRVRRGIWTIHEMTITYENIQNVKVSQGPIQRFFGISNLVVETAGGGGGQGQGHGAVANRALIEGVADAERLRDRVLERLRAAQSAGLGDEGELEGAARWTEAHVAVLREVRDEILALAGR